MTGHLCSKCGQWTDCDKRNMGTGRQKPLGTYGANHREVHTMLGNAYVSGPQITSGYRPMLPMQQWQTPSSIRHYLNGHAVLRKGKRTLWYDADVQTLLSDLVGWGYAEMRRVQGSKKYEYRWKSEVSTIALRQAWGEKKVDKMREVLRDAIQKELIDPVLKEAGLPKGKLKFEDAFFGASQR